MASESELDLFTRSLRGDRRARIELFKKYFRDSSRVRRAGSNYPDLTDFLHDSFSNLLRTGHAWNRQDSLSSWVESVAAWTALQHERVRTMVSNGAGTPLRLCAEFEGDAAEELAGPLAYIPPTAATGSPADSVLAPLDAAESGILRRRIVEKASWQEIAAGEGKPLDSLGPSFARGLRRAVRLFGAPPPLDDDLEPVFSRAAADKGEPAGRQIAMQLDPVFYEVGPELQQLGIKTSRDARMLTLWDATASPAPKSGELEHHLARCRYCASLLDSLMRLRAALTAGEKHPVLLCPGAFTLANTPSENRDTLDQHLAACPFCPQERGGEVQEEGTPVTLPHSGESQVPAGKKIAWTAAVLLLLGAGSFAGYRYSEQRRVAAIATGGSTASEPALLTIAPDSRYAALAQSVVLDRDKLLATVFPANRVALEVAMNEFTIGQFHEALGVTSRLVDQTADPAALLLYAMSLYRTGLISDGYRASLKAEAIPPRDPYRCWIMLQFALVVGDKGTIAREVKHLAGDPEYGAKAKEILARVEQIH